jgi:PAS domain-containing protein
MTEVSAINNAYVMPAVMALPLDAVVIKTCQGMITGWSPVATDVVGCEPEEIIGRSVVVLVPAGWESEEADPPRSARTVSGQALQGRLRRRGRRGVDGAAVAAGSRWKAASPGAP